MAKNLKTKNKCDLVIANDLSKIRNGEHIGYIIDDNNILEIKGKEEIAKQLIIKMFKNK